MIKKKVAFITGLYRDSDLDDIKRLKKEVGRLNIQNCQFYLFDNREVNKGYANGINQGIEKALKDNCEIFVIMNTDISISNIKQQHIIAGLKKFDVLGFAMRQGQTTYYGGSIDKQRLSGGLIAQNPKTQFTDVDFVSGSLMIMKREVIEKVGLFNEKYFVYYEDVEYCLLAKKLGFKVGIDSYNVYDHFEASNINNPNKTKLLFINRLRFFVKFSSWPQKVREIVRSPLTIYEHLPLFFSIIKNSKFTLNFFSLNVSSVLSKATHFLIFAVLVRTLNPSQYGIYTLVWAFVNLFTPFLDFGTTTYGLVYGSNTKKSIRTLFSFRLFLSFLVYLITIVGACFSFSDPTIKIFIALTATSILSTSISGSYLVYNSLRQKVIISSYLNLAFNIVFSIAVIAALLMKKGIPYLFISYALTFFGYFFLNLYLLRRQIYYKAQFSKWLIILRQSVVFVFIGFLANFYSKVDIFILNRFYNNQTLGIYSAGMKFLDAFLIVAGSYNIIVIPIMSKLGDNKKQLKTKIAKDLGFLFVVGSLMVTVFWYLSPVLLSFLLKNQFTPSLLVSRVLVISILPILITSVFYNSLYGLKKERYVLFILITQALVSILIYGLVIPKYSYIGAMYAKVMLEVFNTILSFLVLLFVWRKLN